MEINDNAYESRLQHAEKQDLTNLVQMKDILDACLVKYEQAYGPRKAKLAKIRLGLRRVTKDAASATR